MRDLIIDLANFVEKLGVGQSAIKTRLVSFPVNGNFVTNSSFDIFIQAIVANVGDTALEPLKGDTDQRLQHKANDFLSVNKEGWKKSKK